MKDRKQKQLSIQEHINNFLEIFPEATKEESDFVEKICSWDNTKRSAFILAKRIFEERQHET